MRRLEEQIAEAERATRGAPDPRDLARLGQLYLRAGRLEDAETTLARARALLPVSERDAAGDVQVSGAWLEVHEQLEAVAAEAARLRQRRRREELLGLLEREGLPPGRHDELIRLEVALDLPLHPEEPRCPACRGALVHRDGHRVRCARTGEGGDLCRHMDAEGLFACPRCGQVHRAWIERRDGKLPDDPFEPPAGVLLKPRCERCGGAVADWKRHFRRCPQGRPRDFPICRVCRTRGFHARAVACPRCQAEVTTIPCRE